MVRVTFIGAGSVVFARQLAGDILSFPELTDSELVLMDVDEERLAKTETVVENMIADNDLEATVEATTDRREALDGADYVLNTIHVGGREPFENEIEIPQQYGVGQAVGDTLGPGGVFRALRTAPVMLDIARDMEDVCPDALLLNYTNPMAMLCWAVDEATDVDVIGLCHSVQGTAHRLANRLDVPYEELSYWVAGINHMAWFLELEHDGEDLYPRLEEVADDPDQYKRDAVRYDVTEHFGSFITESSHHLSEYLPYFRTDQSVIDEYVLEEDISCPIHWMPNGEYFRHWCDYQSEDATKDAGEFDTDIDRSNEYGSRIIHSMETGERRRMNINVRNDTDAIANLPDNALVEVPCLVDDSGVHPCSVGELPPQLAALNRSNIGVQELAVKGILESDLESIRQAIKLDPLTAACCTLDEIDDMIDDLLEANAEYVPDAFVGQAETPAIADD
jgi:alpha-galactosidase